MRLFGCAFLFCWLVWGVPGHGLAASAPPSCLKDGPKPILLQPEAPQTFIGDHAAILHDKTGDLDYDAVRRADQDGRFKPHCQSHFELPENKGALWLRLDVKAAANAPVNWVIAFGEIEIDEARLYQALPDGLFVLKRTGRAVPASARDTIARWPAFEMALDPGKTIRLYVRLSGVTSPYASAWILPMKQFIAGEGVDLLVLAAVLGFMMAMLIYNLVVYLRSRLHQCLYYFLYLGFIIVHVVIYDGLIYRFTDITLSGHAADVIANLAAYTAGVALLFFGHALLGLRDNAPKLNAITLAIAAGIGIAFILDSFEVVQYFVLSTIFIVMSGFFMGGCAIYYALRGYRPAVFFACSYFALLTGVIFSIISFYYPVALDPNAGFLGTLIGVQQNWSFHLGICAEAVLISFAITYFIKDMQVNAVEAQAKIQDILTQAEQLKGVYEDRLSTMAQQVGLHQRVAEKTTASFSPQSGDEALLERAVAIITAKMAEKDFDVASLAGELAVSEKTLRRRFNRAAGISPVEFIRQQRLLHAKRLLETKAHGTVAEIATAVGMFNAGRFAKLYRETFGQAPSEVLKSG